MDPADADELRSMAELYREMGELEERPQQETEEVGQENADHTDSATMVPSAAPPLRILVPALMGGMPEPDGSGARDNQGHSHMDTDPANQLPNLYYQARAARDSTFNDNSCSISGGATLGSGVGGEMPRVGSFEKLAADMSQCFTGTRIKRGSPEIQQSGSFSFDPATMLCLCCEAPHPLFVEGETTGICVADQNFPANLSGAGTDKSCVATIRVESAGLPELTEIFLEIFSGITIPPGTTVCLGSATHLHRNGPTIYATDWIDTNKILSSAFPGIHICPLIPVISDEFPGSLAVSVASLTAWFASIYSNGNRGLLPVWADASRVMCECAMPENADPSEKIFVVHAFPESMHPGAKLIPRRIAVQSSCRIRAYAPGAKANEELICRLLEHLHSEFLIGYCPGISPVRTKKTVRPTKDLRTAILYGNSNIRQCGPALQALGFKVIDRTGIKWDGSDSAAELIKADVAAHSGMEDAAFVFDCLGQTAYRFRQPDGSLAMPVKFGGGYHLLGEAAIADDNIVRASIKKLGPVLSGMSSKPTVIVPPLPRYIFGGCCRLKNHSHGSGSGEMAKKMLDQIAHVRRTLKSEIGKQISGKWWLADPLTAMGGEEGPAGIKPLFANDNVHFTGYCYAKIAGEIRDSFRKIQERSDRPPVKAATYYWHGFVSPNGTPGPRRGAQSGRPAHGDRGGLHNNRGGAGRGGYRGQIYGRGTARPHPYKR